MYEETNTQKRSNLAKQLYDMNNLIHTIEEEIAFHNTTTTTLPNNHMIFWYLKAQLAYLQDERLAIAQRMVRLTAKMLLSPSTPTPDEPTI